jgi:hypothetical protein
MDANNSQQPAADGNDVALPAFQSGGLVERTGIALVHEGEYILPSPGSEAMISSVHIDRGAQVVNYYFPVEVQLIGALSDEQLRACADFVYDELLDAARTR